MRRAKIRNRRAAWFGEAAIDALFMAALVLPVYLLADYYEGFESLYQATRAYEDWQLDEVVTTIVFLGWAGFIYAVRRLRQSHHEIALRRSAEDRAHYLARHDALTGLPNRRSFLEELTRLGAPSRAERSAVLIVDLDHFKPINDLHGHKVGDVVLRVVAARLRKIVGPKVLLARLGGDEFGIAMPFTSGDDGPSLAARRIVSGLAEPINVAMLSLQVGASVGIAILAPQTNDGTLIEHDRGPVETVLRQADMAMYRAKTGRRGGYRFFERGMDEELQERIQLERQIRSAIRTGEIIPYYQPLVDLNTNELVGFEVLSRWQHPTRGLLQPAVLIPIAEDTGTINEVTYVLLRQAIAHAAAWPPHLVLSINLSPRQFADKSLATQIMGILAEYAFPARRLEIEITEGALVTNMDETKAVLELLRSLGVRAALDDFGLGYAGLCHLTQFKLDTIKIDRSFITGMLSNPESGKLVEAIVNFSHSLGLAATAEGIETAEVRDRLKQLGCNTGQGFYYSEPQPYAEVQRYLERLRLSARRIA